VGRARRLPAGPGGQRRHAGDGRRLNGARDSPCPSDELAPVRRRAVRRRCEVLRLFGDGSFWTGQEDWQALVRDVVQRWLGPHRRAGANRYVAPEEPFEDALRDAGFERVRALSVVDERSWTVETILGYLASTSFASADLFGDNAGRFAEELTEALRAASRDGTFHERATFGIWIGGKPGT
jgi:hypothetical protein